jgi:hypothetical protein
MIYKWILFCFVSRMKLRYTGKVEGERRNAFGKSPDPDFLWGTLCFHVGDI